MDHITTATKLSFFFPRWLFVYLFISVLTAVSGNAQTGDIIFCQASLGQE